MYSLLTCLATVGIQHVTKIATKETSQISFLHSAKGLQDVGSPYFHRWRIGDSSPALGSGQRLLQLTHSNRFRVCVIGLRASCWQTRHALRARPLFLAAGKRSIRDVFWIPQLTPVLSARIRHRPVLELVVSQFQVGRRGRRDRKLELAVSWACRRRTANVESSSRHIQFNLRPLLTTATLGASPNSFLRNTLKRDSNTVPSSSPTSPPPRSTIEACLCKDSGHCYDNGTWTTKRA